MRLRFPLAVGLGAFLLFGVQPLIGKYALPWFGGSASVWSACLLFFQSALVLGYGWTHWLSRRPIRFQVRAQVILLAIAAAWLVVRGVVEGSPLAPPASLRPEGSDALVFKLLGMLTATVLLPYFAVSTTSPLIQAWARAGDPHTPVWRLYALSNLGSLGSLLLFPFVLEPLVSRAAMGWAWAALFVGYAAVVVVCGRGLPEIAVNDSQASPSRDVVRWGALSALGSVLLQAVTTSISHQVSAGPYVWVLPLCVYLLTFTLTFELQRLYRRGPFVALLGFSVLVMVGSQVGYLIPRTWQLAAHLIALFFACMVCHGELFRLKPAPVRLTGFYLSMAVGGALGSALVTLGAPVVFDFIAELPIGFAAVCAIGGAVVLADGVEASRGGKVARAVAALLMAGIGVVPWRVLELERPMIRAMKRSFFGSLEVQETPAADPSILVHSLFNGNVLHGMQYVALDRRGEPLAYYAREAGLGQAIAAQRASKGSLSLGVIGLGVGASAALLHAGDRGLFYEIDPQVTRFAKGEGGFFSFLSDSKAQVTVEEGDGRLLLSRTTELFDVLAIDAFSGDSIPMHLLTREAVADQAAHLKPGGVLAFHLTNSHVDLSPVVLGHALALNLDAWLVHTPLNGDVANSDWVLMWKPGSFDPASLLRGLQINRASRSVDWTDERASLVPVLR